MAHLPKADLAKIVAFLTQKVNFGRLLGIEPRSEVPQTSVLTVTP